jgi:hypothetical protein
LGLGAWGLGLGAWGLGLGASLDLLWILPYFPPRSNNFHAYFNTDVILWFDGAMFSVFFPLTHERTKSIDSESRETANRKNQI